VLFKAEGVLLEVGNDRDVGVKIEGEMAEGAIM
jgi:hypothetical protein